MTRANEFLNESSEKGNELEPGAHAEEGPEPGVAPVWRPSISTALLQRSAFSHAVNAGVRASALRQAQQMFGNRTAQTRVGGMQAKLAVSEPGDPSEQEAERVAGAVRAERSVRGAAGGTTSEPSENLGAVAGPGRPLDVDVRTAMEEHFGRAFDSVRVHTGAEAAEAASAVNAQAYTVGQDIVFGEGAFNPGTSDGRHLLAHELTHVVQQGDGNARPMIQRRLMMSGPKRDIDAAFGVLEPPSDLDLKHDPKTKEVSVRRDGGKPPSPALAGQLKRIINDDKQHANVHVGRRQEGVHVGAFPGSSDQPQEVRIDHVVALESDAPGHGAALLAHEIVENYEARALEKEWGWSGAFDLGGAHKRALETENLIEKELGHPGARRNTFLVVTDPSGKKRNLFLEIEDRSSHFVVVDMTAGKWSSARRVGRISVSKYKIDGFSASSAELPNTAEATIASLASDMKNNPTASAYVEGFASSEAAPQDNILLAYKRGDAVSAAIIAAVGDILNTNWRRFEHKGHAAKAWNAVVVTLERPDI